jgi:hypothetical protein
MNVAEDWHTTPHCINLTTIRTLKSLWTPLLTLLGHLLCSGDAVRTSAAELRNEMERAGLSTYLASP